MNTNRMLPCIFEEMHRDDWHDGSEEAGSASSFCMIS
jgi:hypothetical protein